MKYTVARGGEVLNKHRKWTPILEYAGHFPLEQAMALARLYGADWRPVSKLQEKEDELPEL